LLDICRLAGYLPPLLQVPNRLNYLLVVEDLLASWLGPADAAQLAQVPQLPDVLGLDIGTGASAIYPLLAHAALRWRMVGTDIDADSLQAAAHNVALNGLQQRISLLGTDGTVAGLGATSQPPFFTSALALAAAAQTAPGGSSAPSSTQQLLFTMCNPPFFASWEEAQRSMAEHRRSTCSGTPTEMVGLALHSLF
jgi:23S rRNA A1618 N6-methylase RlmF